MDFHLFNRRTIDTNEKVQIQIDEIMTKELKEFLLQLIERNYGNLELNDWHYESLEKLEKEFREAEERLLLHRNRIKEIENESERIKQIIKHIEKL